MTAFILPTHINLKRVFLAHTRAVLSMEPTQRVVYLEDLQGPPPAAKADEDASQDASDAGENESKGGVTVAKTTTTAAGGAKRQRTLMDMFSVAPKDGAGPASKKLKASPSLSSVSGSLVPGSSKGTSSSTKIGFVPLNSIPFSLSAYLESLTEDQRRLLQLECETLGKSW